MKESEVRDFLGKKIYHWVGKNFGSQEAEDPSWNIKALSEYLAKEVIAYNNAKKNLKSYELTVLLNTESDADSEIKEIKDYIKSIGGVVNSVEDEGKKRLPYSIMGNDYALYYYIDLDLPDGKPAVLSSWLNVRDKVLRYLLVKNNTRS